MENIKILITGGSGFIGTNLINLFIKRNLNVLNVDIVSPKNLEHFSYWKKLDILDKEKLQDICNEFQPNYIVHLAARTDIYEKKQLSGYEVNMKGVENIISVVNNCTSLKRVIFTSSMLVCKTGYIPNSFEDYCPTTLYGKSKVIGEDLVRKGCNKPWCIIRPTSIWGPWFDAPYLSFFEMVLKKRYLNIGTQLCTKTYGYVENSVYQISSLMNSKDIDFENKIYYIGDMPPIVICQWSIEIAKYINYKIPTYPFYVFKGGAYFGDILGFFGIKFPLTSFRLKNMTTNNILNLQPIYNVAPDVPFTNNEATKNTIEWMVRNKIILNVNIEN